METLGILTMQRVLTPVRKCWGHLVPRGIITAITVLSIVKARTARLFVCFFVCCVCLCVRSFVCLFACLLVCVCVCVCVCACAVVVAVAAAVVLKAQGCNSPKRDRALFSGCFLEII